MLMIMAPAETKKDLTIMEPHSVENNAFGKIQKEIFQKKKKYSFQKNQRHTQTHNDFTFN